MKTTIRSLKRLLPFVLLAPQGAFAAAETWTSKDGRKAEMKLLRVTDTPDGKAATFKTADGKTASLKASDLSDESASRLQTSTPPASSAPSGAAKSVFDTVLSGNLVKLVEGSFKPAELKKPARYYAFYYTASWCGPCQKFTPELVEFYNANKNDNFEIVLISYDRNEGAMENYAKEKKMPWPQLKLKKLGSFRNEFNHGVHGIPSLIVCDLEGKNLGDYRSNLAGLKELIK